MAKIAVLIENLFEDSEYVEPAQQFREHGHEVVTIGMEKGAKVTGKREGNVVEIDEAVENVNVKDYDALLIPGGYSPDQLRAHPEPVRITREFMEENKPVFAICHGPQLLITAKALEGRRATGYQSIVQDMIYAGAEYHDMEVVVDGNLVTSRQPSDIPAFNDAALSLLKEEQS